jgi:hypothetical protein
VIRTNLATRPFYNERAAHALIALVALLVLAFTVFNVYRIVSLSGRNTALSAEARHDAELAQQYRQQAAALRGRIDQTRLKAVLAGAREANALIDRRTFSWTEFFNLIERTMPDNVMLTSVSPTVQDGRTLVSMVVIGRRAEDLDTFMEQLEATRAFRGVLPRTEDVTEEGLHRVLVTSEYLAPSESAPAGEKASDAPQGEQR